MKNNEKPWENDEKIIENALTILQTGTGKASEYRRFLPANDWVCLGAHAQSEERSER